MKTNDLLYSNIKALVNDMGYQMGEFEKELGVSAGYFSRTHRLGKMLDMQMSLILNCASKLGTTLEGLMTVDYAELKRVESIHARIHELEAEIERLKGELSERA